MCLWIWYEVLGWVDRCVIVCGKVRILVAPDEQARYKEEVDVFIFLDVGLVVKYIYI